MRSIQITPVIGLPKFDGWAQMVAPSENIHLVIAVSGKNAPTLGKEILEWLSDQQFNSPQDVHEVLEQLQQRVVEGGGAVQLALHAHIDEKHVFAALGGSVMLKRGQKVGVLLPVSPELRLVVGALNQGDVFVLSTEQAAPLLNTIKQQLEQGFESDSIITSTVPIMHSEPDSSLSALLFGDVVVQEESVVEPVEEEVETELPEDELNEPYAYDDYHRTNIYAQPEVLEAPEEQLEPRIPSAPVEPITPLVTPSGITKPAIVKKIDFKPFLTVIGRTAKVVVSGLARVGKGVGAVVQKRRDGGVYVEKQDFRRWARILVPVIGVILAVVVVGGIMFARRSQQIAEANEALQPLQTMLQGARNEVSSNPIAARQEVSQVIGQLEQMEQAWQEKPNGQKRVIALLNEARQLYEDISGREEFKELETFYDLVFTAPGEGTFLAQSSFNDGNQAVFVDKDRKEVISLELDSKQFQRQKLADDVNAKDVTLEGRTIWLLGGGLRRLSLAATAAAQLARPEEDANRAATFVQGYGPNLYILNPEQQTINRYAPTDGNYGDATNWVRSSQGIAFDQVTSMAIDGDIWLGTRDGQIKKLTTGRPVEFAISGLSDPFSSALTVVTSENLENIYVLEPSKSRVVVLTKTGEYLREFKSASLASATDILVNEETKQLLAVSGSLLLSLPL